MNITVKACTMEYFKQARRQHLVIFTCLVQCFFSAGLLYGFSVMYANLIDVFNTSRFTSAMIQGTFNLFTIGGGILWAFPSRRFGFGLSMACGALMSCVGLVASSMAPTSEIIIVSTGVICGAGLSVSYIGSLAVTGLLYKTDAGFPIALLTVAASVGMMVIPHIYRVLLERYHWSGAFILLGGIALQGLPCGIFIHYSNSLLVSRKDDNNEKPGICNKGLCMDTLFWRFVAFFVLPYSTANFELWFLVDQVTSLGHSQRFGTTLISVIGFTNILGRILGSIVKLKMSTVPAVYHMFYTFPILALGHTLMILLQTIGNWIAVACLVHGFAFGLMNTFILIVIHDLVENEQFPQAVFQLSFQFAIGNLLLNFVGGRIRDNYGDYNLAYELGIAAAALGIIGAVFFASVIRKRRENKEGLLNQNDTKFIEYKSFE